ncbi:hypothetical protein J2W97_001999 [Paenibacillus jamilae]|jgi:hypothetical protein|uniref:Uncharacterized protein n=1 Tax=Paenibacillus polymyxa TaxID=1406 RepID=A0A378XUI5_PAEPO|nr:hypothetical protein PPSQR21_010930 [Paenibacillus polymyxa SQR-21]MDP9676004.1 hypothetical protein [Paenibacillus jamilae]SUA66845.1 Uncharacterised protein [Paenibacillus polymyxa]
MIKKMAFCLAVTSFLLVFTVPAQTANLSHGTIQVQGHIGGS